MQTILITGAASGLGRHMACLYAQRGFLVYALDINDEALQSLPKENMIPLRVDISKEEDWDNIVVPAIHKNNNKLDITIACAAVMRVGSALDCSMKDWNFVNSVNLTAQFLTAKKTIPFLKESKGNILFIGSPSAKLAVRDEVCYVTFKHAICGLSKSVAFDFAEDGIRSNVLHPGWMRTAMSDIEMEEIMERDNVSLEEAYDIVTRFVPMKRPGTLDEICEAAFYLTSEKASYINGTELMVDGGLTVVDPGMIGFL